MQRESPLYDSAIAHWLEHLAENLKCLPTDARRIAYLLLYSPWDCSRDDVLAHVPSPLC